MPIIIIGVIAIVVVIIIAVYNSAQEKKQTNIISCNSDATVYPENTNTYNLTFEDTIESFDQSFFQTVDFIETFSPIEKQNRLFQAYFNELNRMQIISYEVKTRIKNAEIYVDLMQGMKEQFGFLKGDQTGYGKETYYQWMNLQNNNPKDTDDQVYHFCNVVFSNSSKSYAYLVSDQSITVGDTVIVPVGADNIEKEGTVVSVGEYLHSNAPYPPEIAKAIIRKV